MSLRSSILTGAIVVVLIAACSDDGPASDGGGTEVGDGDGDPSGDGDGDPSGDGDGDPSGDGDGDPTGDGDCEAEGNAYAAFNIVNLDEGQEADWDLLCTLDGVGPGDSESGYLISMSDCVSQNGGDDQPLVELFVDSNPSVEPIPLANPGTSLHLRYVAIPPFIPGKWFTVRSEPGGFLFLAGFDGPSLTPSNTEDFDYAPLDVALQGIGCTPFEHPSQCGLAERMGLEVGFDGEVVTISDGNSGYIGPLISYQIIVGELLDFPELNCDDFPNQILRGLFVAIPEG